MALKNVMYVVKSNNGASFIYVNSENTVTTNTINSKDCVGPNFLGIKFFDTSTISVSREVSYGDNDWFQLLTPSPINSVLLPGIFYSQIVSAVTTTNSHINLVTVNSGPVLVTNMDYVTAPYMRFKITAHRSCAKVSLYYSQQEEEGGW